MLDGEDYRKKPALWREIEFSAARCEESQRELNSLIELLQELSRCTAEELTTMFGVAMLGAVSAPATTSAPEPAPHDPRPQWMKQAGVQQQRADSGNWRWDERGNRIGKLPSSFPRQCYDRPRRPPGARWMSD